LILPDLLRHLWNDGRLIGALPQAIMRGYYLTTPAIANIGLLVLLLYRFEAGLYNRWLWVIAAPYYYLYGRDLRFAGYRWSDLLRVYAVNLLLLPVNLAGVLRSLQQGLTGRKAPFGRTPKIEQRTSTPAIYVLFQWFLLVFLAAIAVIDIMQGLFTHAIFALVNVAFYVYGISPFLGGRNSYLDLRSAAFSGRRSSPSLIPTQPSAIDSIIREPALTKAAGREMDRERLSHGDFRGATESRDFHGGGQRGEFRSGA